MGQANGLILIPYGNEWRQQRRIFHLHMNKNAMSQFNGSVQKEARTFVGRLHEKPAAFSEEFRLCVSFLFCTILFLSA